MSDLTQSEPTETPEALRRVPKATGFVIAGFAFTWAFALLPGLMGTAASYGSIYGAAVVVGFAVLMIIVMFATARNLKNE